MKNITDLYFDWFYQKWQEYCPGDLIDKGILPSQIAERFVEGNQKSLLEYSKKFDEKNLEALDQFMKLSEAELHVLKYFLKLVNCKIN